MALLDRFAQLAEDHASLIQAEPSPLGTHIDDMYSATEGRIGEQRVILAGTNNYLGLTYAPACIDAAVQATRHYGTGTTGSRMANGNYAGHTALEQELCAFFQRPAALLFSTGYLANLGSIAALTGPGEVILLDADCHASIYDACRLSGAEVIRFRHNDAADLDKRLKRLGERATQSMIIVEGIYSMLGDQAPLADIVAVKKRYQAFLVVDEAHSVGVLGKHGRGLAEAAGVEADVDLIIGTFSKSLGAIGGFAVSIHPQFDMLRYASRPYIFTASSSPASIASVRAALQTMIAEPGLRERLWQNAEQLYAGLDALGFQLGPHCSPVVAVRIGDPHQGVDTWRRLLALGVYVNLVLPPASPDGRALIRISVSAAHSAQQIEQIIAAFQRVQADAGCAA